MARLQVMRPAIKLSGPSPETYNKHFPKFISAKGQK
jgi:hypothetical protein